MSDSSLPAPPVRPALLATLVGLAGGFLSALLVPQAVFQFRTAVLGAVCVGLAAVALAGRDPRQVVLVAVFAEFLRAAVLFAFSGVLVFVYGRQDPGFLAFYLLFGGGAAAVVGVVSIAVAGAVGGVGALGRRVVGV